MAKIEFKNVGHSYDQNAKNPVYALKPFPLSWDDGGRYALLGPSGCGKTTMLNIMSGLITPSEGNVLFKGEDITGTPSYELFSKGLLRTFQIAHEFTNLTVLENLMMVPGNQSGEKLTNALFNSKIVNSEEKKNQTKSFRSN